MLVYMLEGATAGQFVSVTPGEGRALIQAGKAQNAKAQATSIKTPNYETREMRASTSEESEEPKPKRKRRTKAEMEAARAEESEAESDEAE